MDIIGGKGFSIPHTGLVLQCWPFFIMLACSSSSGHIFTVDRRKAQAISSPATTGRFSKWLILTKRKIEHSNKHPLNKLITMKITSLSLLPLLAALALLVQDSSATLRGGSDRKHVADHEGASRRLVSGYGNFTIELADPERAGVNFVADRKGIDLDGPPIFAAPWYYVPRRIFVSTTDFLTPRRSNTGTDFYIQSHPDLSQFYYIRIDEPRYDRWGKRVGVERYFYLALENGRMTISQSPFAWQFVDVKENGGETFALYTTDGEFLSVDQVRNGYGFGVLTDIGTTTNPDDAVLLKIRDRGVDDIVAPDIVSPGKPTSAPSSAPTVAPDALKDDRYFAAIRSLATGRYLHSGGNDYSAGTGGSASDPEQEEWTLKRLSSGNYQLINRATTSVMGCNQHEQIFAVPDELLDYYSSTPLRLEWQIEMASCPSGEEEECYKLTCAQYETSALADGVVNEFYTGNTAVLQPKSNNRNQFWIIETVV